MTLTCGLKLTHDGAVAVCRDDVLLFSVEVEKLDNNARYGTVHDTALIERILETHGLSADQIDRWVVDGWDGRESGVAELDVEGVATAVTVAPYRETDAHPDPLEPRNGGSLVIGGAPRPFTSYVHIAGHIMSAYCTSEAARRSEDSFVLVWDGGLFPRLYFVEAGRGVSPGRELFPLTGHTYATAAHHFGPYRRERPAKTVDDLAVAGKLMAYIALGEPNSEVRDVFLRQLDASMFGDSPEARAYRDTIGGFGSNSEPSLDHINAFFTACRRQIEPTGVSDEDVLATFHHLLEELLVDRVRRAVLDWKGPGPWNLCFVGGCALNIKWNSALRAQRDLFSSVWVPPFPNDSGSAIGTAVAEIHRGSPGVVHWSVDAGPALPAAEDPLPGWRSSELDIAGLAKLLHEAGEPIVTLHGRSELGPRALGSRSILAPATNPEMKDRLNEVKDRESYRPVAPICLEDEAPEIFDPGTPDPYMLFDHEVRPEWRGKVPAIVHLDGTARLQTVSANTSPFLHELLTEYAGLSGIPVLCNTSANFHGCGFFPDATSAMRWGRVPRVWSNGRLYEQGE